MCGIAGTIGLTDDRALTKMLAALQHRGPDDEGIYRNTAQKIFLGHRRLSIIDISSAGHQPMSDDEQEVWVIFNGEIYNYKKLAADLRAKGYRFHSTSDTEVLIHGYKEYGADIFEKIDGMWAVALYDTKRGIVMLSRDRAGMKPLYFYRDDRTIMFASEIGAIASVLPPQTRAINRQAITNYLAHGYIAGEATAYEAISSLSPATVLTINLNDGSIERRALLSPQRSTEPPASIEAATKQFKHLFRESVRATLQADVPVGIFLSGGIDSALVAHHAHQCGASLHSFTIGFEQEDFDESKAAAEAAAHLGFPHTEHIMRASDIARDIDAIFDAFGQPFADTSSLPTYYLAKLARENGYKVALSGDGADELFGG
jgi:asparagine synthase (glutamine-hydrolysing)